MEWITKNRERARAIRARASLKYYHKHPHKALGYHRKSRYPAPTRPDPGLCEMCGGPPGKLAMSLDHCHKTNTFRGWLCNKCNVGLGALGDNIERAIENLQRYKAVVSRDL